MTAPAQPLLIRQREVGTRVVRLSLLGELDVAAERELEERLAQLRRAEVAVRLDLSQLSFIDCGGLHEVMGAVADAQRRGWPLQVDDDVSGPVRRLIALTGTGARVWPRRRTQRWLEPLSITDAQLTGVVRMLRARRTSDRAEARGPAIRR